MFEIIIDLFPYGPFSDCNHDIILTYLQSFMFSFKCRGKPVMLSWIFAFAFVSIGAETSIREFGKIGRAPAIAFTVAQTFNVIWTLAISYILFSAMG